MQGISRPGGKQLRGHGLTMEGQLHVVGVGMVDEHRFLYVAGQNGAPHGDHAPRYLAPPSWRRIGNPSDTHSAVAWDDTGLWNGRKKPP